MWLESKEMLKDRIYGVRNTLYHDPYYQRHVVSAPRLIGIEDGDIRSEANYVVVRTKREIFRDIQRRPLHRRYPQHIGGGSSSSRDCASSTAS